MVAFGKQMKRASLELQRCPFGKQPITVDYKSVRNKSDLQDDGLTSG